MVKFGRNSARIFCLKQIILLYSFGYSSDTHFNVFFFHHTQYPVEFETFSSAAWVGFPVLFLTWAHGWCHNAPFKILLNLCKCLEDKRQLVFKRTQNSQSHSILSKHKKIDAALLKYGSGKQMKDYIMMIAIISKWNTSTFHLKLTHCYLTTTCVFVLVQKIRLKNS